MANIPSPLPRGTSTFLAHRWARKGPPPFTLHVSRVGCKNLWHKVARFHICFSSKRQHNGAAPVAGSPEAARRGTTWDHRAAGLCMTHVLALRWQTGNSAKLGDARDRDRPSLRNDLFWSSCHSSYLSVQPICHKRWGQLLNQGKKSENDQICLILNHVKTKYLPHYLNL